MFFIPAYRFYPQSVHGRMFIEQRSKGLLVTVNCTDLIASIQQGCEEILCALVVPNIVKSRICTVGRNCRVRIINVWQLIKCVFVKEWKLYRITI